MNIHDTYLLTCKHSCIELLGEARVLSTVDLNSKPYRTESVYQHRDKTRFTSYEGQYMVTDMLYAQSSAPEILLKEMKLIVAYTRHQFALLCADSVIIFSTSTVHYIEQMCSIVPLVSRISVTLEPSGCYVFDYITEKLGQVVLPDRYELSQHTTDAPA